MRRADKRSWTTFATLARLKPISSRWACAAELEAAGGPEAEATASYGGGAVGAVGAVAAGGW